MDRVSYFILCFFFFCIEKWKNKKLTFPYIFEVNRQFVVKSGNSSSNSRYIEDSSGCLQMWLPFSYVFIDDTHTPHHTQTYCFMQFFISNIRKFAHKISSDVCLCFMSISLPTLPPPPSSPLLSTFFAITLLFAATICVYIHIIPSR